MKAVALGGAPASGKTTMTTQLLKGLGPSADFSFGKVKGHYYKKENLLVLGIYDGSLFSGTDRLSMAVQPDFLKFLQCEFAKNVNLFFEGDRLFNETALLATARKFDSLFIILETSTEERDKRAVMRGDTQKASFIKGRITKYLNLLKKDGLMIHSRVNQDEADSAVTLSEMRKWLGV